MKRNERTEKFKDFLRKEEELNNNWKAQRALGYKPLDKPIHHGYDAYWVLRDDVARRADADKFYYPGVTADFKKTNGRDLKKTPSNGEVYPSPSEQSQIPYRLPSFPTRPTHH